MLPSRALYARTAIRPSSKPVNTPDMKSIVKPGILCTYCVWLIILGACFLHISRLLFVCFVFHVIRNGTISHHYASTLTEMLTDIQNATFSCVVCDANGIVLFPRLSEILRLGDIRLPTRVPLSCLVLLRELGYTPSILNEHREYYFTH